MNLSDLVTAWENWDADPGKEHLANQKEDALVLVSLAYEIPSNKLHGLITAKRREGLGVAESIGSVIRELSAYRI